MTRDDEEIGRWRGQIETEVKNLSRTVRRHDTLLYGVLTALAGVTLKQLGIWPW